MDEIVKTRILIYRTDRIGDLLYSCPLILAIKKNFPNSHITLIASNKNYLYAKDTEIFDDIYQKTSILSHGYYLFDGENSSRFYFDGINWVIPVLCL